MRTGVRFGDFLEICVPDSEICPCTIKTKHFRMALCQRDVQEHLFSTRFCAAKPRPTWRFFAEISDFHEIRRIVPAICCETAGINRSREELSGGQILVENIPMWQKLWSFKVRGWWADFLRKSEISRKIQNFKEHRKCHGITRVESVG